MKTPQEIARECADRAISFVEGEVREWLPGGEFAAARDELTAFIRAALTAATTEQAKDTERLDWLERFLQMGGSSLSTTCTGVAHKDRSDDTEATRWNHDFSIGYQVEVEHRGCYRWEERGNGSRSIRSAIDAAREQKESP